MLIAEKRTKEEHGKVYGAHFAWSHFVWAIACPVKAFTGAYFRSTELLVGVTLSMTMFVVITLLFYPRKQVKF